MSVPVYSESSKPSNSAERSTKAEYVVPTLDQYDSYFAERPDERYSLEKLRDRYRFHELGCEYGVNDQGKAEEIQRLLEEIHYTEVQISTEEDYIHELEKQCAQLEGQRYCYSELVTIAGKLIEETNRYLDGIQSEMHNTVEPRFYQLRLEYLQKFRIGTNEEIKLLEEALYHEITLQEEQIKVLEEKCSAVAARKRYIESRKHDQQEKRYLANPTSNHEIRLLMEDIAEMKRQLMKIQELNRKG